MVWPTRIRLVGCAAAAPWVVLAAIGAVALGLRIYQLDRLPGPIYSDEAQNGVDALAVLAGWRPVFFPANNGREPLHIYLEAASIAVLGPTDMALRIVNALVGTATVVVVALLGRVLAGYWRVGLLGAAWLAVSYWHLTLSRLSFRVIELPLWTALAALLFALTLRCRGRRRWLGAVLGGASLGLCLYTYTSARIFPLAFLAVAGALYVGRKTTWLVSRRRLGEVLSVTILTSLVVAAPLLVYFARHVDEALLRSEQVRLGGNDDPRVWHDGLRPRSLAENLGVTLGAFAFVGDRNVRHNLPGRPVFDFVTFAALGAGVVIAARRGAAWLVVGCAAWIAVMLIPTAASVEAPHFLRMAGVIPPTFVLVGVGADQLLRDARRWSGRLVAGLLILSTLDTAHGYFGDYRDYPSRLDQFDAHVHAAVDRARVLAGRGIPTWGLSAARHPLFYYELAPSEQPRAFFADLPRALGVARSEPGAIAIEAFGHGVPEVNEVALLSVRPVPAQPSRALQDGALAFDGWEVASVEGDPSDPNQLRVEAWLYWHAVEPLGRRFEGSLVARDQNGGVLAVGQDPWASTFWPSTLWHPDERYATRADLRLRRGVVEGGQAIDLVMELAEVPRQGGGSGVLESVPLGLLVLPPTR